MMATSTAAADIAAAECASLPLEYLNKTGTSRARIIADVRQSERLQNKMRQN
jgi:hypothetical protein